MLSTAGTPSSDPWVILPKERIRYEEQFRSLKPSNGIVTGEQAKGFFLLSKLPPLLLGQIWGLADTDSDGKMDINEFSIACKLINLKLRGYDVPKMLPPTLLASLKQFSAPAIPPLPTAASIAPPARPQPPPIAPVAPVMSQQQPPLIQTQPQTQQFVPNLPPPMSSTIGGIQPVAWIPTGIVPPMQPSSMLMNNSIPSIPPPVPVVQEVQPMQSGLMMQPIISTAQPLATGLPTLGAPSVPLQSLNTLMGTPLPTASLIGDGILTSSLSALSSDSSLMGGLPISAPAPLSSATLPSGPSATSTPRASLTNLERAPSVESPSTVDWALPQPIKLKYTQMFNTLDRVRSGYLSGAQARNIMVQSKLSQNLLAQIWALSDMDGDGRLGCEEFVLAMYLCEQGLQGQPIPHKLPNDLIPPSFRRPTARSLSRTASISSQGSGGTHEQDLASLLQTSFEDKRKENFDKGQAELERRRKTLLDQQKKEAEERERKEREEIERREKARQEVEKKRLEELEKQMREQQERERLIEEERKRETEQREAARKEMERQRQLEWEKQRLQELQQQRQREQENVLKLKAKNQSLSIELSTVNEQVKELSQKICDTRLGVSNVKCTIDGMRTTRDSQMHDMSQLKNKLKEQNARLLALSQEKVKLEARNKHNIQNGQDSDKSRVAFDNKEISIKNLKEKVVDMQSQIDGKISDIENNNSQLDDLKNQLNKLISECENLYSVYDEKRNAVLELKVSNKSVDYGTPWKDTNEWNSESETPAWPAEDDWKTSTDEPTSEDVVADTVRYRALYEFVARNNDEISFQPGDLVNVPRTQNAEPGWLAGEIRGHTGWFPESYVEPVDGIGISASVKAGESAFTEVIESKPLEGIAEVPEHSFETPEKQVDATIITSEPQPAEEVEFYVASYAYQSQEPGDLTFNAGDIIAVLKKDGDWWTGKLDNIVGIFPSNYVQKNVGENVVSSTVTATENSQVDNEISQINEANDGVTRPLDAQMISNAQIMKSKKPEIASVIAPYQASSPEQLSLARGQLIMIRKKTDSGWWEGELQAKGRKRQVGWFPASYVKVLNSSGRASGRTTPVSTTRIQQEIVIDKVVALFPYTAGNPDELTFAKDDIISVTAREEEAWWRGELNGVSGLFPSNYVAPLQSQCDEITNNNEFFYTISHKKRQDVIKELIETEKSYVGDLIVVSTIFEKPLRSNRVILQTDINTIFLNWQDILMCNTEFLSDLMERSRSGFDIIGDIISIHIPKMTPYIGFCSKQADSAELLRRLIETSTQFKNFVNKCQLNPDVKGLPLSSFFIKPMQRITRYPLLISKIIESTPENHTDNDLLKLALKEAEGFVSCINENIRVKENLDRLDWLQQNVQNELNLTFSSNTNKLGPRKLVYYGLLTKLKNGKELIGFLFNDMFILVQASKSIGTFTFQRNSNIIFKIYKQPILMNNLTLEKVADDNTDQSTDSNRVLKILDASTKYSIDLLMSSNDCYLWVKKIEAVKDIYSKVTEFTTDRSRLNDGLYLKIEIVEAKEILTKPLYSKTLPSKKSFSKTTLSRPISHSFYVISKHHSENIYCKVMLGDQEQKTGIAKDNLLNGNVIQNGAPQIPLLIWNYSMQFHIKNMYEEVLNFIVYQVNPFSPDQCLGQAELKVLDIFKESEHTLGPITKNLILHQAESGEITVKLDLQLFD